MNATRFQSGDLVIAKVTAQGVVKGEVYRVTDVTTLDMGLAGLFTSYYLQTATVPAGPRFTICTNGHLLLARHFPDYGPDDPDLDAIGQGAADDESELQMRERDDHWSKA